jgi:hypothetical protein
LFKKIVLQLKGLDDHADQRHEPRVGLRNEVSIRLLEETDFTRAVSHNATVRDLSPNGIGLVSELFLAVDSLFAIRLPVFGEKVIVAVYKVTHSDLLDEELFSVGGRLMKVQYPDGRDGLGLSGSATSRSATAERALPPAA